MKSVLVVEDDVAIRETIVELLQSEGYDVVGKENGQLALDYLKGLNDLPSVILLDLMMPVMDGWEFRRSQMADNKISKVPVIVITADGNARDKAHRMDAQGWVKKPIKIDDVLEAVARLAI